MMKKDLTLYTGSPLSRLFKLDRFGDFTAEFDKLWKNWDLDMRMFSDMQPKVSFPKINVTETDEEYVVEIALAGFKTEDISLELKDNCLCVKADSAEESSEEDRKYLMKEISSRSFRRVLNFPTKVLPDNIKCDHDNGIVRCVLLKDLPKQIESNTIKIDIK